MDPETLRAETPALENCCYLNTGASGPSPRRVVEAADECERHHQYRAPAEEGMYTFAMDRLEGVRERVASFLGTTPEHVAFTNNTAEGINHVAAGMDWEADDVVVRTDLEHAAGRLPWQRASDRYGVEVRTLQTDRGRIDMDDLKDAVADARLLCLNSVTWNYGTRLPISDIVEVAHDAETMVLVDAVQSPGQIDFDVEEWGADFVACSGHKWLLGLWGSGMLYVSDEALDELEPDRIGYFSVTGEAEEGYEFHPDARRFELGTRSISPYAALEEAIDTIDAIGMDTVESHIERLSDRLKDGLGDRLLSPRDARSGLVAFEADQPEQLVDRLAAEDIQIRWLPEPYACRASVHVFNTTEDVDRLLEALPEQ